MAWTNPDPCPFCGHEDPVVVIDGKDIFVECHRCRARGPVGFSPQQAMRRWRNCPGGLSQTGKDTGVGSGYETQEAE